MKLLSLLLSLLLGAAVLVFFLRPWEANWRPSQSTTTEVAPVETLPPPEAPSPQPTAEAAQAPKPPPKRTLLAREQAEAKRDAALKDDAKHAITPERRTKRYFQVRVRDAGTLEADLPSGGTVVIRLEGIEARGADEDCTKEDGTVWPCGAKAKTALTLLIRSRAVICTVPPGGEASEFSAKCSLRTQDLATWLVRQGWATPRDDREKELAEALEAARSEGVGLWEGE